MHRITRVRALNDYRLDLAFSDGTRGTVDLTHLAGHGVFAGWRDQAEFRKVAIGQAGELLWPGDIDLCPDALYLKVTGKSPEEAFPSLKHESAHA